VHKSICSTSPFVPLLFLPTKKQGWGSLKFISLGNGSIDEKV